MAGLGLGRGGRDGMGGGRKEAERGEKRREEKKKICLWVWRGGFRKSDMGVGVGAEAGEQEGGGGGRNIYICIDIDISGWRKWRAGAVFSVEARAAALIG